jgi:hypothetical protein
VTAARKVLGAGIGMCPKPKLFSGYIELEMRLREFDRVRELYQRFLTVGLLSDLRYTHADARTRSMIHRSVPLGSNGHRSRVLWRTLSVFVPSSSWPFNKHWICLRLYGRYAERYIPWVSG